MTKELIIGRFADSPIAIPVDRVGVSGTHAKIVIHDNGNWEIEDLDSSNGTYIKDKNGNFQRVFKKDIKETTIIRLGQEGHSSFIFMAHKVLSDDKSYAFEFRQLKKLLKQQLVEEEALENKNTRNMKIVKAASPLAMGLCVAAQYGIPGLRDNANLNLWISRGAMAIAPAVVGLFFGIDRQKVKALKQKRLKIFICPKCGCPISEFDIQNMQCSRCKAK